MVEKNLPKPQVLKKWISSSLEVKPMKEEKKKELIRFWNDFYEHLLIKLRFIREEQTNKKTKSYQYKEEVFDILHEVKQKSKKDSPINDDAALYNLQIKIEDLTMSFDEECMFKSVPNIIRILIREDGESAKDSLRGRELEDDDVELLSVFGQYTIEALIVHVLGMVFNPLEDNGMIRVSTLIERLESGVRSQALLLTHRRRGEPIMPKHTEDADKAEQQHTDSDKKKKKGRKLKNMYPIGSALVQFMEERKLITIISDVISSDHVKKNKGSYYLPKPIFAYCNFDVSYLPIQLNLPMVYRPRDWKSVCPPGHNPRTLSDLTGGYLSGPTGDMYYERYRLISSSNLNHFYIDIKEENHQHLCDVMNKLQHQAFQVNSPFLNYLKDNEEIFVQNGLLMPKFLASMNLKDVETILREFHLKDERIKRLCSFSELINTLSKDIQRARYEQFLFRLATAYEDYYFYLPAFLDFRGRIYRCGVLHFHERDLARSLIIFADSQSKDKTAIPDKTRVPTALAFHYKSFVSESDAHDWLLQNQTEEDFLKYVPDAKHPFQFLSFHRAFFSNNLNIIRRMPITQDASASAYHIMSYFLLDETMAKRTNLIPSLDGEIQDVYTYFLEELKEFMKAELEENLSMIVSSLLTRKIVKGIFMPIIYGKTLMSTASDLKDHLSHFITHKECFAVASVCFKFWRNKYSGINSLIQMIRSIGWLVSASDRPVKYRIPNLTTVQDYMIMEPINIWIYDRHHKKRRRVTLRVSSSKRDRRKTEISTFVNFIHQKDAHIAMSVVNYLLQQNAQIYTVHDNFISTPEYSNLIPHIYGCVIREMGPPLSIINDFIYMNIIQPFVKRESDKLIKQEFCRTVIPKEVLNYYLRANVPEKASKQLKATWEEKITGILSSYETYSRIVCGSYQGTKNEYKGTWIAHEQKWFKFRDKLRAEVGQPYYCVHH